MRFGIPELSGLHLQVNEVIQKPVGGESPIKARGSRTVAHGNCELIHGGSTSCCGPRWSLKSNDFVSFLVVLASS